MRNLFIIFFLFIGTLAFSQKKGTLTVNYNFIHIAEGYDHVNKIEVYIDDKLVATSSEKLESIPNSVSTKITRGTHKLKILSYCLYEGKFELRSVDNDYTTEGTIEREITMGKKNTLQITFDLDIRDPIITFK